MAHLKPHRAHYFRRVLQFFGNRESRFVITLIATGMVFSGLWHIEALRPVLVPVGAALATLFGAVPGLMTVSTKGKIVSAVLASALVGVGTWYTTFDLEHEKKGLETRLNLLRSALSDYANGLNQDQREALVLKLAKISRQRFNERQFDHVEDLATLILQQIPGNGHGLYFYGEVWRVRRNREDMRGEFNRYRSKESGVPLAERDGEAEICYQRPSGFCAERTAWIDHMMANDYYQTGTESKDSSAKAAALSSSCNFLQESVGRLDRLPAEHFPHGFDASTSFYSTQDLEGRLQRELAAVGVSEPCALPPRPAVPPEHGS